MMRTCLAALLLCLATLAGAQAPPILTDQYPSPDGSRTLELRGLFAGADTVLVQVYHDSDLLAEEVRIYTWALALGTHDWYVVKFTDGQRRVKYLYILELADEVIEYVPEITIDFDRRANLLLLKPASGKPDFLQFDVGLARKHR